MTIRRHLPPADGRRLLRDAGPPTAWAIAALIVGAAILAFATTTSGGTRIVLVILWLLVLAVPSVLDRDGWRIRIGMGWLAAEQRRRMQGVPKFPRTPTGAERWLKQPAASDAGLTQAAVLLMAGKTADARQLVESHPIENAEDRARVARMLAAIDGLERGRVDPTEADAAIAALPVDARRYHQLSLAWSTAWVDSSNRRPWRRAFADASRGIGTAGIPARYLAYGAFQEMLLPIVGLLVLLLLRTTGWL